MAKSKKPKVEESLTALQERGERLEALINLGNNMKDRETRDWVHFNDFLYLASHEPQWVFRDIFQYFHDMIRHYVPEGIDEYANQEETIGFLHYNFSRLFVEETDDPFLADRLFANRLMNLISEFKKGIQNNHIYLFEGPPGSGKSTFLNNLLNKLELYNKTNEGAMYRTIWRLDIKKLGGLPDLKIPTIPENGSAHDHTNGNGNAGTKLLEIACPSNDHPILQIPRDYRERFLDELISDKAFKKELFESKEYRWVLKGTPCSICTSLYNRLLELLSDPLEVFKMIYARRTGFDRQFGKGISVFNPGDELFTRPITDQTLQSLINNLLRTDQVRYIYSHLAHTNNGVYALMDIKENNVQRLTDLHGIISDGVHKVELVEEKIRSLFVGLVNPEDKKSYENVKSFQDRILHINIPYVLDYATEVAIYKNKFGEDIEKRFLPRVLENFARIIIASRLEKYSPTLRGWIKEPERYDKYLDDNHLLLKMELYRGIIPEWLTEEDFRSFNKDARKGIIAESEKEGMKGISGRQSLSIFNSLLDKFDDEDKLITMQMLRQFIRSNDLLKGETPEEFVDALQDMYDYTVLQEVKESIYFYSEKQINRDILNYLFAINFEPGSTERCPYTQDVLEITDDYFKNFEAFFLGALSTPEEREEFRNNVHNEYITQTLSVEIKLEKTDIRKTKQFTALFEKYTRNLKENALRNYSDNDHFRRAIAEYGQPSYKKYEDSLKQSVNRLISNLTGKFGYTESGACQVSIYVLENKLDKKY
jgi:predicted Ser/Thr protein kinase